MPANLRNTRQKAALRTACLEADRPLSPDEGLRLAHQQVPGMRIATVYRNIGALVEEQWLTTISLPGETARYEVAGKEHHHHFRCNRCHRVYELPGCSVELKPDLPPGFRTTGHELFLFGTCDGCA